MKTLTVFLMAIVAINAFYITDDSRNEFIQEIEKLFMRPQKFGEDGAPIPHDSPMKFSELMKTLRQWSSLTREEKKEIKGEIFGAFHPRPMPAHHSEKHHSHFDKEKSQEMHEKWEAMTPEEREEFINNKRKEHHEKFEKDGEVHRFPRPMPHLREDRFKHEKVESEQTKEVNPVDEAFSVDLPHHNQEQWKEIHEKWAAMTPEEHKAQNDKRKDKYESLTPEEQELHKERLFNNLSRFMRNHHGRDHPHFDEEKIKEIKEKWDKMTKEEREEIMTMYKHGKDDNKRRHPRSIQAIRPLPEFIGMPPHLRSLPNLPPIPRIPIAPTPIDNFQPIQRLPEFERPMIRPAGDFAFRPFPRPERPIGDYQQIKPLPEFQKRMIRLAEEEKVEEMFPEGLPIRVIAVIITEEGSTEELDDEKFEIPVAASNEVIAKQRVQGPITRPMPMPEEGQFQPIMPVNFEPIAPLPEFF